MNNPTMHKGKEQPETNMGNSGGLNNKQPTATQCETRWKTKENNHCNPMGDAEDKTKVRYHKKERNERNRRKV